MLTSIRGLVAATLVAGSAMVATPALAQESDISISGNAAVVSDYRFRGVGLSGGDIAIQGGIDVAHSSGFYVGTWGSSIDGGVYGSTELDIYGGWSGEVTSGVTADVGVLYYAYPNATPGADVDVVEFYGSLAFALGPAETTLGVAYAPEQDGFAGDDNLYVYGDIAVGIPGTPVTINGHLGYTDGALAPAFLAGSLDKNGLDWSLGASFAINENLSVSAAYTGVEGPSVKNVTDDAVVATLSVSF